MTTKTKKQKTPGRVPFYRRPITIVVAAILVIGIAITIIFLLRTTDSTGSADSSAADDATSTPRVDFDDPKNAENPRIKPFNMKVKTPMSLKSLLVPLLFVVFLMVVLLLLLALINISLLIVLAVSSLRTLLVPKLPALILYPSTPKPPVLPVAPSLPLLVNLLPANTPLTSSSPHRINPVISPPI